MPDAENKCGYVYAIQGGEAVKIGWSSDPLRRLKDLSTSSPIEYQLLGMLPGTKADERRLHFEFAASRIRGEWFKFDIDMRNFIASLPELPGTKMPRKKTERDVSSEMTREQCRAARAVLNWSRNDLAAAAGVSVSTIAEFESGARIPYAQNVADMRHALELAGVIFVDATDLFEPGIRFRGVGTATRISQ